MPLCLSALFWCWWARWSRTPWREIGYVRPKSWIGSLAVGIAFGCAFKFLMKSNRGAAPRCRPDQSGVPLAGRRPGRAPSSRVAMFVGAGFGEETVFRGYLFERLGKLLGTGAVAKIVIVVLGAGLFAIRHYSDQGLAGVQQATITGLVFSTIFAVTGRIWMLMFAHAAFDLTALAMIYWNLG